MVNYSKTTVSWREMIIIHASFFLILKSAVRRRQAAMTQHSNGNFCHLCWSQMLRGSHEWLCWIGRACLQMKLFGPCNSDRVSAVIITSANTEHWLAVNELTLAPWLYAPRSECSFGSPHLFLFYFFFSGLIWQTGAMWAYFPVWVSSERWILCACVGSAPLKCGGPKQKGCTLKKKQKWNKACARGINNHPSQWEPWLDILPCGSVQNLQDRPWDLEEQPRFHSSDSLFVISWIFFIIFLCFSSFILASSATYSETAPWTNTHWPDLPVLFSHRWPPTGDWQLFPSTFMETWPPAGGVGESGFWSSMLIELAEALWASVKKNILYFCSWNEGYCVKKNYILVKELIQLLYSSKSKKVQVLKYSSSKVKLFNWFILLQ